MEDLADPNYSKDGFDWSVLSQQSSDDANANTSMSSGEDPYTILQRQLLLWGKVRLLDNVASKWSPFDASSLDNIRVEAAVLTSVAIEEAKGFTGDGMDAACVTPLKSSRCNSPYVESALQSSASHEPNCVFDDANIPKSYPTVPEVYSTQDVANTDDSYALSSTPLVHQSPEAATHSFVSTRSASDCVAIARRWKLLAEDQLLIPGHLHNKHCVSNLLNIVDKLGHFFFVELLTETDTDEACQGMTWEEFRGLQHVSRPLWVLGLLKQPVYLLSYCQFL